MSVIPDNSSSNSPSTSDLSNSGSEDFFSPLPPPLPLKTRPSTRSTNPVLAPPLKVANPKPRKLSFTTTPSSETLDTLFNEIATLGAKTQDSSNSSSLEDTILNSSISDTIQIPTMSAVTFLPHLPILTSHDTVDKFIRDCEAFLGLLTDETEKSSLTTFILVKLPEQARKIVDDASATTWPQIKLALRNLTTKTRAAEDIQAELISRNQRSGESLEKYGKVMLDLLSELTKAYSKELQPGETLPTTIKNINERQALRAFETGIRSENLRMLIFLNKSKTLSDAVSCATTYEGRNPKKGTTTTSSDSPSTSSTPLNSNFNKPTCENCKKFGHTAQTCRTKPTIKVEQNGSQTFCNYCKEPGHIIADCKTRKQNNLKKYGTENWAPPRNYVNHVHTDPSQYPQGGTQGDMYRSTPNYSQSNPNYSQSGPSSSDIANPTNHVQNTQNQSPNPFRTQGNDQLRAVPMDSSARIEDCHNL